MNRRFEAIIGHKTSIALVVTVFALGGLAALSMGSAATYVANVEAENGRVNGPATVVSDPLASGGSAVTFKSAVTPPPSPTGGSLLKPARSFTKYANLRYSDTSSRLLLDLYIPDHDSIKPLVVYVHGGYWANGSKDECPPAKGDGNDTMMQQGFAVACINYRLSDEAIYPAQIQDVKASIRWLRANAATYGLFAGNIGIWGGSAGGHLAALAGTTSDVAAYDTGANLQYSSKVAAVVDYFGPVDLVGLSKNPAIDPRSTQNAYKFLGGDGPDFDVRARAASPSTYVSPGDSPFYIVHGDRDRIVPHTESILLDRLLTQSGVSSRLVIIPGAGHGGSVFLTPERLDAAVKFLDLYVR